jgi:hypothetical protein
MCLVVRCIREWLGEDTEFLIDGADVAMSRFITGILRLSSPLHEGFQVDQPWNGTQKTLRAILKKDKENTPAQWKRVFCDANIYDAASLGKNLEYDPRSTGRVNKSLAIRSINETHVELKVVKDAWRLYEKDLCRFLSSSSSVKAAFMCSQQNKPLPLGLSLDQWLDLKRAGDHGQVEHAARYNQVIVTCDRRMAFYAYARGVRCIWAQRHELSPAWNDISMVYRWMLIRPR